MTQPQKYPSRFVPEFREGTLEYEQICILMSQWGVYSVRDVLVHAISECYARERDARTKNPKFFPQKSTKALNHPL